MMHEKWDILNENGLPTGRTTLRGHCFLKNGEYHLVVHIWVISSDGKILIQRRSDNKPLMPGEWAATGGAAISGEDSETAAKRELFEELGIDSKKHGITKAFRIKRKNSLLDVWFTVCDLPINSIVLQKSEVAEVKWVTLEELKSMIDDGMFHNYGNEYFSRVFDSMESFRGAIV